MEYEHYARTLAHATKSGHGWRLRVRCSTRNDRPSFTISANVKIRAAQSRPVAHQTKSDAVGLRVVREPHTVVNDRETNIAALYRKADIDLLGSSMFDRICHRLLRNSIKLVRNRRILNSDRVVSVKGAVDLGPFRYVTGELPQRI
jgi:hypothetical protein